MRKALHLLALVVALGAILVWAGTGANRGWTKTSVERVTLDEVTGLESRNYEKKFLPGVDFLGVALGAAAVVFGASFLFRRRALSSASAQ
jgi:hypothetical protein